MNEPLTAIEAAARLGVKRETLYAYVSRGLLDRTLSLDGRTSLFDPEQIDTLRATRRRPAQGELRTVITTGITEITESGHRYRGIPVDELTTMSFEEVADVLWADNADWPDAGELQAAVTAVVTALPDRTPPVDRLRVSVAVASGLDPFRHNAAPTALAAAGRSMILAATTAISTGAPSTSKQMRSSSVSARCAAALRSPTTSAVSEGEVERAVDLLLILLADHGLAASTFSARIAASVRADPYSIVAAGLGPLGGRLHGAASRSVHELFEATDQHGVDAAIGEILDAGRRLPGVGHTVYVEQDRRQVLLSQRLADVWGDDERWPLVVSVHDTVRANADGPINIDFALGSLTWLMGAPVWAGEALFAIARIAGWIAHGIEESAEAPLRFRPTARYVTPPDPDALVTP